jgi:glucose-6-phosphate dehydrogenase assembly protein OpcA
VATAVSIFELGTEAATVADVERQLAALRRRASAMAQETVTPPARAAVLNVVVYARRQAHVERAARVIAQLGERHPSRAIVLFHDREGSERVLLRCSQVEGTNRQVCCEQILVRTGATAPQQLRSVVVPLLLSDLPVFLWWTETPPLRSPLFGALATDATRLVFDSADFARPERTMPLVAALIEEHVGYGITDLNWARLTAWRELIAQFFDVPEWRVYLDAMNGVRIGFAVDMDGREIHPSQALLLLGWLAAGAGWRADELLAPSEAGGMLFRMRRQDGAPVWVRLRPRFVRGVNEGDVTGIRLLADREQHAEFVVKRVEDGVAAHADVDVLMDGAGVLRRRVFLPKPGMSELLAEELSITRGDRIYESALASLCSLTGRPF